MTTTKTKITTDYGRELNVAHSTYDVNLHVKDTDGAYGGKSEVYTGLSHGEAAQLAAALVGENATVITDLPVASEDGYGYVEAGTTSRLSGDAESILQQAKNLLAIHAFIVKRNEEKEEEEKRAEKARKARRDELTKELTGNHHTEYAFTTELSQKAIDRIIDLEEAAKVS